MKHFLLIFLLPALSLVLLSSCEELIDINLNDADPRIVIEADLDNSSNRQFIYVTRTVPFNDARRHEVVRDAQVRVESARGTIYSFVYQEDVNAYVHARFGVEPGMTYQLLVTVDDQLYEATEQSAPRVPVDSLGMLRENIFGDTYYFATLRFQDPPGIANYYKYSVAVDGNPMKFFAVYSDKFNDGLYVMHQIGSVDNDIQSTSQVVIKRQSISANIFRYWNDIQSTNPGSAAPANPTSNISNGALGYFSVASAEEFRFDFSMYLEQSVPDTLLSCTPCAGARRMAGQAASIAFLHRSAMA